MPAPCKLGGSLLVFFAAIGGCGSNEPSGFHYQIDPGALPEGSERPDGRPLAAVQIDGGRPALFIADEVLIAPRDRGELDDFLARTGGAVVADNAVPAPPTGITLRFDETEPTEYVVRVDPSRLDLDRFVADADAAGVRGSYSISSEAAARLLAVVTRERRQGRAARPNFAFEGSYIRSSIEHPKPIGFVDAFTYSVFAAAGSKSDVVDAWRLVAAKPPPRRSLVAIIDNGFWLDPQGRPMSATRGSDLPGQPAQWDFLANDGIADGANTGTCTGGATCNWHGNSAAGAAVGIFNNGYGAAGTGGQVADPILLRGAYDEGTTAAAIRTAVAWGADVVSMSFGGECDNSFCDLGSEASGLYGAIRNAHSHGVVLVASAGNGANDGHGDFVGYDTHAVPCRSDHVICVGALANGSTNRIRYSNFGRFIDIWAPTNVPVMPEGDDLTVHNYGGTSASAPFVAGIAAMMRAYDPTVDSDAVGSILYNTGGLDSTDERVESYVNAFQALRYVAGSTPPEITVLSPAPNAEIDILALGGVEFSARTNDLEDGLNCCTVTWSSLLDGAMGEGHSLRFPFDSLGARLITAEVEDSEGGSAFVNFGVNVVEGAPTVVIDQPGNGERLWEDTPVTLAGRDVGLGLCLGDADNGHWSSDVASDDVPADGCTVGATLHGLGEHVLTFQVTAPRGTAGTASVIVNVDPKPPVVASLLSPTDGAAFNVDNAEQVLIEAHVEGEEPVVRTWTWLADEAECPDFTIPVVCPLLELACSVAPPPEVTDFTFWDLGASPPPCIGAGRIRLDVTDGIGQTASDEVAVTLLRNPH